MRTAVVSPTSLPAVSQKPKRKKGRNVSHGQRMEDKSSGVLLTVPCYDFMRRSVGGEQLGLRCDDVLSVFTRI